MSNLPGYKKNAIFPNWYALERHFGPLDTHQEAEPERVGELLETQMWIAKGGTDGGPTKNRPENSMYG